MVLAIFGWGIAAVLSAGASVAQGRIWPVVLGSTAGYLTFTSVLLTTWVLLYGRKNFWGQNFWGQSKGTE